MIKKPQNVTVGIPQLRPIFPHIVLWRMVATDAIPLEVTMKLIDIFGLEIDFELDLKPKIRHIPILDPPNL